MNAHRLLIVLVCGLLVGASVGWAKPASKASIDAAFDMKSVHVGDKATVAVVVRIEPGLHVQSTTPVDETSKPFTLKVDETSGVTIGKIEFPPGEVVIYTAGRLNVYRSTIVVRIPVTIASGAKLGRWTVSGKVGYQACNDSVCFFPETQTFSAETTVVAADQPTQANAGFDNAIIAQPTTQPATQAAGPAKANWAGRHGKGFLDIDFEHAGVPIAFGLAFLIGIVFNAMPCVLPVLPLKIMGFYEVSKHDRRKSVLLGTVFSVGLVASFGVLALLVVGFRTLNWGGLFNHAWFNATISLVLVAMAISTFGFFTINVPNSLYAFTPRHDTYVGNFLFGVLTAALSTPCTFGMFVGLLAWAIRQPSLVGVSVIMMVGVGMAFPYLVLSAVPEVARKFPRTGPWAEVVKQMMGFLLLATAIYFAQPFFQSVLSSEAFWWTMFAVVAAAGVFLVVRSVQLSSSTAPRVVCAVVAVLLVAPAGYLVHLLTEKPYTWQPYSDQALAAATAAGKPVVIDFTAAWCGNCHYLEAVVLHSGDVIRAVNNQQIVMLQADVTHENAPGSALLGKLSSVGSIPLTAVYLPHTPEPRLLDGIYSADDLVDALKP